MEAKSAARASRASSFVVVQFHARLQHPMSDTDGFTKQAAAGTPSSKGGQGGLGEAISPTRDCMAQALSRRV
ncbi:hypothetical protein WJX82_001340 [Trebouxia sp. C0006]